MTDEGNPRGEPGDRGTPAPSAPDFATRFRQHNREVFQTLVARDLAEGADAGERARAYAERGKPDFVLAYLLTADLADDEKRDLYANAFERRAVLSERRADDFDRRFHRPFPLVRLEATKDRQTARRIRSGGPLRPGAGRPLPTL